MSDNEDEDQSDEDDRQVDEDRQVIAAEPAGACAAEVSPEHMTAKATMKVTRGLRHALLTCCSLADRVVS